LFAQNTEIKANYVERVIKTIKLKMYRYFTHAQSYNYIGELQKFAGSYNKTNPGRFAPITCSPRKVSRFAPLNRYYIIIDEVFFDNFWVIIYLLVVCKKNNLFILVYFNYLFISCIQINNNSFILVYFCQRSQAKLFLQNFFLYQPKSA
jgi:hypothetical protein